MQKVFLPLVLLFIVGKCLKIKGANSNGTAIALIWKGDVWSSSVANPSTNAVYGLSTRSNNSSIIVVNFTNPKSFTVNVYPTSYQLDTVAGVFSDGNIVFTQTLKIISIVDSTKLINNSSLSAKILLAGPVTDSIVSVQENITSLYIYKSALGVIKLTSVSFDLKKLASAKNCVASSKISTTLYVILLEENKYILLSFDYITGIIRGRIDLPVEYGYTYTFVQLLISYKEEFIVVYANAKLLFYKISGKGITYANSLSVSLSAATTSSNENMIIAKDDQSSSLLFISMEKGTVINKFAIQEKEYLTYIYTTYYETKSYVILTDLTYWYAYEVDKNENETPSGLVNGYVILMSSILGLGMIIAVIYLLCKRKSENHPEVPPPPASIPPPAPAEPLSRDSVQRQIIYQAPVNRTNETRIFTDLNESSQNFVHGEINLRKLIMCPLTGLQFKDPVIAADGYTYEKVAIEQWFTQNDISPVTQQPIESKTVIANNQIAQYLSATASPPQQL